MACECALSEFALTTTVPNIRPTNIIDRLAHPDSKVHGTNMGPTRVLSVPDGPHVGPMNLQGPYMHDTDHPVRVQKRYQILPMIISFRKLGETYTWHGSLVLFRCDFGNEIPVHTRDLFTHIFQGLAPRQPSHCPDDSDAIQKDMYG